MEDNLNLFLSGRHSQLFCKWKMTSNLFSMEDNLNLLVYGRRPKFSQLKTRISAVVH
jgi:hypothetical protein